jgi:hypothetical protein
MSHPKPALIFSPFLSLKLALPTLVAGRLSLSLTNLPDVLKHDHLLSSPLTSYLNRALIVTTFGGLARSPKVFSTGGGLSIQTRH